MKASNKPDDKQPFPTFASLAEAEAYSDKTGDAYFEICYHLEGKLNLCLNAIHDLYANAPSTKRQKMQTGLVREIICPEGWPKHPETLVCTLACCGRFRHEDTCHAYTVNEALTAFVLEKQHDGTLHNVAFDRRTFEPITSTDTENARSDLLRLCDWIESRLHYGTHSAWYGPLTVFPMTLTRSIWQTSALRNDTLPRFQTVIGSAGKAFMNARRRSTKGFESLGHGWQGATRS